jgi:uncharacterized protein (TIGR02600 family)
MALLLELVLMVFLVSVLVISVMFHANKNRVTSSLYSNSVSTRILSNSVLNLVIGEIRDATSNDACSWASQPGAIRTFNTGGGLAAAYKLYSSDDMVVSDASLLKKDVPSTLSTWENKPEVYVNLNQPVARSQVSNGASTQQLFYPIADPSLLATNLGGEDQASAIKGYDVKSVAGYSADDYKDRLPMPVKWLYYLKDGTLSPMADDGTIAGASGTNPIMGRVAFWTDDETSKVNLNTAGEGFYWTTPHAYSYAHGAAPASPSATPDPGSSYLSTASLNQTGDTYRAASVNALGYDFAFAYLQPANREYNRYPGHPAQTCLSAVFPDATLEQLLSSSKTTSGLAPIYGDGGTLFGSRSIDFGNNNQNVQSTSTVYLHSDRLYATVDDAAMQAKNSGSSERPVNYGLSSGSDIRKREFLLTTRSRAPELNLFNRPRICMWPVDGGTANTVGGLSTRTAFDNLIALCSTVANRDHPGDSNYTWPFLFYRSTGNNYAGSSGQTNEMTAWPSNQKLYSYLQDLASKNIPGYGGSFQNKYGDDCNQILTETLDYIRCTNICDISLEGGIYNPESSTADPGPEYTRGDFLMGSGQHNGYPGHGQAVPLVNGNYQGLGRALTVSEVDLHVTRVNNNKPPYTDVTGTNPPPFQATLAVELSSPTQGFPGLTPYVKAEIDRADLFKVNGVSLFPGVISFSVKGSFNQIFNSWYGVDGGGYQGPLLYSANDWIGPEGSAFNTGTTSGASLFSSIPFAATDATTGTEGTYINIATPSADKIKIKLYAMVPGDQAALYQTISLPAFCSSGTSNDPVSGTVGSGTLNVPVPGIVGGGTALSATLTGDRSLPVTRKVSHAATNLTAPDFFLPGDKMFSIIPKDGDFRLTAAMATVPSTAFVVNSSGNAHYLTSASSVQWALTDLKIRADDFSNGRIPGAYETSVSYDSTTSPKGPPASSMTVQKSSATHDWSTGITGFPDGPWSNFPDAGKFYQQGTAGQYPLYFVWPNNEHCTGAYMFDPYRQVCSPGMFGGLPTGVKRGKPWQTLLFRPQASGHPDTGTPPDYLFMDLFWMPVVEPYAISEPFSTAGKISLNTEIVPFVYLKRQTGIYAVMKAEKIPLIHKNEGGGNGIGGYKVGTNYSYYYDIDIPTTLKQFDTKFDTNNDVFRSASQICEVYLAPKKVSGLKQYDVGDWSTPAGADNDLYNNFALTGENLRERPYTNLYSRLTTQSNTYRVHFWVETVQKAGKNATPNTFIDPTNTSTSKTKDAIIGQMRGSFLVERYIDSNDSRFGNGINPLTDTLSAAYKYRVMEVKQFNP